MPNNCVNKEVIKKMHFITQIICDRFFIVKDIFQENIQIQKLSFVYLLFLARKTFFF